MRLHIAVVIFAASLLTGCIDAASEYYTFGYHNGCYSKEKINLCSSYKAYDEIKVSVSIEGQAVSVVQKAYDLDASNTIFRRLENCKVIDKKNFSCDGLTIASGKLTSNEIFAGKLITSSWVLSLTSYFNMPVEKSILLLFIDYPNLINFGILIFLLLFFLGLTSRNRD
jgi:hypothetical protein